MQLLRRVHALPDESSHAPRQQTARIHQVNRAVGDMHQLTQQHAALAQR
ncbi:hypothetical protein OIV68_33525 [Burkholderia pseudomallei]|nr:hypothetical protein [Burkholderia pseudomallei]MCW0073021.1 hypothetical protein [Burkholderia pseudomallei]